MSPVIQFALQVLQSLPALIEAGHNVSTLLKSSAAALRQMGEEKRDPTDDEWADLNTVIDGLRSELHSE